MLILIYFNLKLNPYLVSKFVNSQAFIPVLSALLQAAQTLESDLSVQVLAPTRGKAAYSLSSRLHVCRTGIICLGSGED